MGTVGSNRPRTRRTPPRRRPLLLTGVLMGLLGFVAPVPGFGAAPVIDSLAAVPATVAPDGVATITVEAHDPDCPGTCTTGCGLYVRADLTRWSPSAGTILSEDNGVSGSPYTATIDWQAPMAEGVYTITVELSDSGSTFLCGERGTTTVDLSIQVATSTGSPPVVTSVTATPGTVYSGQQAQLLCEASDPDGDPVSFSWATDLGTVTPGAEGGGSASAVLESDRPGIARVTCTASDSSDGSGSGFAQVAVTDAVAERMLAKGLSVPHRLAIDDLGDIYVVDRSRSGIQVVNLFSGEPVYRLDLPGVTSVAVDWARDLVIGTVDGARVIDRAGRPLLTLEVEPGAGAVADVAVDPVNQRYVTLHRSSARVVVHDAAGSRLASFGEVGDGAAELRSPGGVAVAPGGEIVVADAGHGLIKVYQPLTGTLVRSYGGLGSGVGTFVRLDDVEVGEDGVVWASDSFQDWVQSFDPDGTPREVLGTFGGGLGEFKTAAGVGVSGSLARLVAASVNSGSLQVFRTSGTAQPAPAPVLAYAPGSLFFGSRPVGMTSAARQVTLTNGGTAPLGVRAISTEGDFHAVSGCPGFLDPGQSCQVSVTFTPGSVGTLTGALLLDTSDPAAGGGGPVSVPLSGTGVITGGVVASPGTLRFSDQQVGTTSEAYEVLLSNPGTVPVRLSGISVTGPYGQTNNCPTVLSGGQACTVFVYFTPMTKGDYLTGSLTVRSDAGTARVDFTGQGTAREISSLPGRVDFGTRRLEDPPTRKTIVLANTGTDLVQVEGTAIGGAAPGAFSVEEDGCTGRYLWLEEQCTVTVAFVPTEGGTQVGELRISSTAPLRLVELQGVVVDNAVLDVPTLSEWGLWTLITLLGLGGAMIVGRRA